MKQVQKNYFISYALSDQDFWVILKITSSNLCKPNYDIINYSTSICPFQSGKYGKEGKKLQKFQISWERKELFRWNKKHLS